MSKGYGEHDSVLLKSLDSLTNEELLGLAKDVITYLSDAQRQELTKELPFLHFENET